MRVRDYVKWNIIEVAVRQCYRYTSELPTHNQSNILADEHVGLLNH